MRYLGNLRTDQNCGANKRALRKMPSLSITASLTIFEIKKNKIERFLAPRRGHNIFDPPVW